MALKSPISPKPSKSKYQSLGYMFGSPRVDLDPNILPTKLDVIQFWMNLADNSRTSRKLSPDTKNQVRDNIITSVVR